MGKVISFFLASSILDLVDERVAVGDFINQINGIYQPMDVFIRLYKCEDETMDHAIMIGGTQKSLNEIIQESDFCFVLFWHKAGSVTEQELRVAYESFKKNNHPKIVVYFKKLKDGESYSEDVNSIMRVIDDEMLHYHREYEHIDSLKLGIITQLQVHEFIQVELKVENEKVTIDGTPIASTSELPLFYKNDEYNDLVERLKESNEKCSDLKQKYEEDIDNNRVYREYLKQLKERDRLKADVDEITNGILNITTYLTKMSGKIVKTEKIQKAIKCFDDGDYQGVLDILTPEEIEKSIMCLDAAEQSIIQARNSIVDQYRLRIYALMARRQWDEVYETFRKASLQVEKRQEMSKSIMLEFALFLFKQKRFNESMEVCNELKKYIDDIDLTPYRPADLYELMGELQIGLLQFDFAEQNLMLSLTLRESNEENYENDIKKASTCVKLARLYNIVNLHFKAENLYLKALELYKKYDIEKVQPVDAYIANVSLALGDLYYMINRHSDSARLYLDACDKYRELSNCGKKEYESFLAQACNKAAYLYISVANHKETDRCFIEALLVKQYLTHEEPIAYYKYLCVICQGLAKLWHENGNIDNAKIVQDEAKRIKEKIQNHSYSDLINEKYDIFDHKFYQMQIDNSLVEGLCEEALRMHQKLVQENPEAFETLLAQSHNVFGIFYTFSHQKRLAEMHFAEAIKLQEILCKRDNVAMKPQLAYFYSSLANNYNVWNQNDKARQYILKAIEIYNEISQHNAGAFANDLARNYRALANLSFKEGQIDEAETYFLKALMMYIHLYKKSPRAYIDRIINIVADIAMLLNPIECSNWMNEFIDLEQISGFMK